LEKVAEQEQAAQWLLHARRLSPFDESRRERTAASSLSTVVMINIARASMGDLFLLAFFAVKIALHGRPV
jgi:hypothetical protein